MDFSDNKWDAATQEKIIRAGEACPVAKSVDTSMELEFNYNF
jgi:hypothetical protein